MPLALVTGAGVRVGRAIALALADAGFDLVLHANRSRRELDGVAAEARRRSRTATAVFADLGAAEGTSELVRAVAAVSPRLDVLVNSAGLYERVPFAALTRAQVERMMRVNVEAPLFLVQGLLPLLRAAPSPCVVNVTDVAVARPYAGYAHYMVSKAALEELTKALAVELAPEVRVNAVAPGTVAFPEDFDAPKRARILARVPAGREGTPEDVGRAVVYLVRDAPYVTGHTLTVDGGALLG